MKNYNLNNKKMPVSKANILYIDKCFEEKLLEHINKTKLNEKLINESKNSLIKLIKDRRRNTEETYKNE